MLRLILQVLFIVISLSSYAYKDDSTLLKLKVIEGKISPKSIVHSGNGKFFAQNMMYKHTITVYDRNFTLLKTISDKVELKDFGFKNRNGFYRGAPVECAFTHNGKYAWVSNYNMTGGEEDEFAKPGCDNCHGTGVYDSSFVYKINTETLSIEDIVKVGSVPKYLGATPNDEYVLVTNWSSSDLSIIDTKTGKEFKRIRLGTYPRGIEIDSAGNKAYIAIMGSDKIAVIDLKTFEKTWIKDVGKSPRHLCISPKNDFLYVSLNGEGIVGKIDLTTNQIEKIKTGSLPRSMVLSDDGIFLYVVNYGSDKLTKVRTLDMKIMDNIKTNDKPIGITFDAQTKNIWVACYEGSIMVFHDSYYNTYQPDALHDELVAQNSNEIDFRKEKEGVVEPGSRKLTGEEVKVVEVKFRKLTVEPIVVEEESTIVKEKKEVVVESTNNGYYLVVGSFSKKENASRLVDDLKLKGYKSFTYYNSKNKFTYACVASFQDKTIAVSRSKELKADGVNVWVYKKVNE